MKISVKDSVSEEELKVFLKNRNTGGVELWSTFEARDYCLGWLDDNGFHANNGLPATLGNIVSPDTQYRIGSRLKLVKNA